MVPYLGDYDTTETVRIPFNTFTSDDPAASCTITNLAAGDVEIHKDGSTTQRASDSGVSVAIDFDGITGNHFVIIDLSDDTDAGFYANGSRYAVRIEGVTIDGGTVNAWIGTFSIGCVLRPTTAGRKLDVSAGGEAGVDWANVGSPTTTVALTNTTINDAQKVDVNTIKTQAVTCAAGVTIYAYVGASATPGAANGLLIAGSNAATTFATLTVSGATSLQALGMTTLTASGAVAFQSTFAVTGTTTLTGAVTTGAVTLANLTSTGALTVSDGIIVSCTTGDRSAISATGNGSGAGLVVTGGATGYGASFVGGGTSGDAIHAAATDGDGAHFSGGTNGAGINADGDGSGEGIDATGGATGHGIQARGGATSGSGIYTLAVNAGNGITAIGDGNGSGISATGEGSGHGLVATGGGTGYGMSWGSWYVGAAVAYPLLSADTGATAVARVGADSDTLETLSDQLDTVTTATGSIYWAKVSHVVNDTESKDMWTIIPMKDGVAQTSATGVTLTVKKRSDGTALINAGVCTQIGATSVWYYNAETTERINDGNEVYDAVVTYTCDAGSRTALPEIIGRDG